MAGFRRVSKTETQKFMDPINSEKQGIDKQRKWKEKVEV